MVMFPDVEYGGATESAGVGPNLTPPILLYEKVVLTMPPLTLRSPLMRATIEPPVRKHPPSELKVLDALEMLPLTLSVPVGVADSVTPLPP